MDAPDDTTSPRKGTYHHGELREALLAATRELIVEVGAENFSLADACRRAGVSTAAPYRHFRDKAEILEEIVARGFDDLSARSAKAVESHGHGTLAGIVAMGQSYLTFAQEETAIFRVMFGQDPVLKQALAVRNRGHACFAGVIAQVEAYCAMNGVEGDAQLIAVKLWTFVHGASCLLIDGDYGVVVPDLDVAALIEKAAPELLSGTA